jgi:hypothetical protein
MSTHSGDGSTLVGDGGSGPKYLRYGDMVQLYQVVDGAPNLMFADGRQDKRVLALQFQADNPTARRSGERVCGDVRVCVCVVCDCRARRGRRCTDRLRGARVPQPACSRCCRSCTSAPPRTWTTGS